jgi:hypothetical protein
MATETKTFVSERTVSDQLTAAAGWIVRWIVLIVLAGLIVVPIAYAALGGFKDNFQLSIDPIASAEPWLTSNTPMSWRPRASGNNSATAC